MIVTQHRMRQSSGGKRMTESIPGFYPAPDEPVLTPPWANQGAAASAGAATASAPAPVSAPTSATPGFYPAETDSVLLPPWLRHATDELGRELVDTRTRRVRSSLPRRDPGRPSQSGPGWRLMRPDGERLSVDGFVILGRKPAAQEHYPGAVLASLPDPTKTVSKAHAVIAHQNDRLFVLDLSSTNGTSVVSGGTRRTVSSTEFLYVPDGAVIELGSYMIGVEREV
jgi:hypothetical protein